MKAQILCRTKPGETRAFDLAKGEAILGREPGAVVELAMEGVSRRHARVTWDGKNHWIEDLKSTNGTFLNGQSVQRDKLRHLDVITLGKKVDLLFVKRGEAKSVTTRGVLAATLTPVSPELIPVELPLGDTSLGRNVACNVVLDKSAISKMHARIERSAEQVVVRDLESVNGTFVNGARVTLAVLRDQDLLSLAGVEDFRVAIRTGEVTATAMDSAPSQPGQGTKPVARFNNNWKTRFDWSQDEKDEIQLLQQRLAQDAAKPKKRDTEPHNRPAPRRPGSGPIRTAPDMTLPLPAADVTVGPTREVPIARPPAPVPPAPPPRSTATTDEIAVVVQPPSAPTSAPEVKTSAIPVVSPHSPSTPLQSEGQTLLPGQLRPQAPPRVAEVRLTGNGFDLGATEPGIHTMGRSVDSNLRVNHATVSRHHARLILTEDRTAALIQDLGGANGTLLNGALLKKAEPLAEGDIVQLGDVKLLVRIEMAPR